MSTALERERYQSLPTTVFSPAGKLIKVETNAKSSSDTQDLSSPLSIALHCCNPKKHRDFVLVLSTRFLSPHLYLTSKDNHYNNNNNNNNICDEEDGEDDSMKQDKREDNKDNNNIKFNDDAYYAPLLLHHNQNSKRAFLTKQQQLLLQQPIMPMTILGKSLMTVAGGNVIDTTILLRRIQEQAISLQRANASGDISTSTSTSSSFSTSVLARRLADAAQLSTQTLGGKAGRMLKSSCMIVGTDMNINMNMNMNSSHDSSTNLKYNSIWRIDPTGQFWNCDVAAVGRGAGMAEISFLKRILKWKQKGKCHDNDNNNNDDDEENEEDKEGNQDKKEEDDDDDDDNVMALLSMISNQEVKEFLSSLDVNQALALASEIMLETLFNNYNSRLKQLLSSSSSDSHDENKSSADTSWETDEWIQFRDLQCMILDISSSSSPSRTSMKYLDNTAIFKRVQSIKQENKK